MRIVRHPTGFIKVELCHVRGRTLRLHIWPLGYRSARVDPHDHRCNVLSIPLIGRFIEKRYVRTGARDRDTILCADNGKILEPGPRDSIVVTKIFERRPGIPWICPLDHVHSFQPRSSRPHMTLVVFGRRHKDRATVFQSRQK